MLSFRHTMRTHLGEVPEDRDWRSGFGTPLRTQLAKFARNHDEVEAMTSTYVAYTNAHHDRLVEAYPGVHEMLTSLRTPGRKFAIVTSKNRRAMDRGLRISGLAEFFDVSVTTDDVDQYKPHPAPVVRGPGQAVNQRFRRGVCRRFAARHGGGSCRLRPDGCRFVGSLSEREPCRAAARFLA